MSSLFFLLLGYIGTNLYTGNKPNLNSLKIKQREIISDIQYHQAWLIRYRRELAKNITRYGDDNWATNEVRASIKEASDCIKQFSKKLRSVEKKIYLKTFLQEKMP